MTRARTTASFVAFVLASGFVAGIAAGWIIEALR
jgi:hypothetical protein